MRQDAQRPISGVAINQHLVAFVPLQCRRDVIVVCVVVKHNVIVFDCVVDKHDIVVYVVVRHDIIIFVLFTVCVSAGNALHA